MEDLVVQNCSLEDVYDFSRIMYYSFLDKFPVVFKGLSDIDSISVLKKLFESMIQTMNNSGLIIAKHRKIPVGVVQVKYKQMDKFSGDLALNILKNELGFWKGWRAGILLSFLETKPKKDELVIDGICVDENYRSLGIGKHLLDYCSELANSINLSTITLKVILKNERGKQFYERYGFENIKEKHGGITKRLANISGYSLMKFKIKDNTKD